MEETREKLLQLLDKKELSAEEKDWLLNYIESNGHAELQNILKGEYNNSINNPKPINTFLAKKILRNIHKQIGVERESRDVSVRTWFTRIAVAASVIGILSYSGYFLVGKQAGNHIQTAHVFKNDVAPVAERAILALGDGSKIKLDEIKNGTVINQAGASLTKTSGKLAYNADAGNGDKIVFNTVYTPRGGKYRVELPDKTEVWLNAASSIRYPTAFAGKERIVEITGEAYFEVTKNKAMPFVVKVNNSEVRVFGTHFNVMAYNDEGMVKTTLLEGSVKCVNGKSSCMLKPGEQSELDKAGQFKVSTATDADDAVAWKNGMFHFENVDIAIIMRQLARTYNVDVVYNKKVDDHFFAEIPTNSQLSEVLKALELTGKVRFDIQGRQVIVNP